MTSAGAIGRCPWGESPEINRAYHDLEWGRPVTDDIRLFEKVCLEGFQSGLSWLTILNKRENFRHAFAGFDPAAIAGFGDDDVGRLLGDAGIIRHRGKIRSTINNASRALELQGEAGSLAAYFWAWAQPEIGPPAVVPASTPQSAALSKDLKRRGWTFVGPTTIYAFMQAMGLVNDHVASCESRDVCTEMRRRVMEATL